MQDCVRSPRPSAGAADEAGKDGEGEKRAAPYVERWRKPGTGRNGNARVGYFEIP